MEESHWGNRGAAQGHQAMTDSFFTLSPRDITSCPVKVQNSFNPLVTAPTRPTVERQVKNDRLRERIFAELSTAFTSESLPGRLCDLTGVQGDYERRSACLDAMDAGADIILNAELPESGSLHLQGAADILLRGPDTASGRAGYYPVLLKRRLPLSHDQHDHQQLVSTIPSPFFSSAKSRQNLQFRWDTSTDGLIQLAALWRLLESCDHAPARPSQNLSDPQQISDATAWGAFVGVSTHAGHPDELLIMWVSLEDKQIRTFASTSTGLWKKRSALNRCDHERDFRVKVAKRAMSQTRSETDPPLAVSPVMIPECATCEWWQTCEPQLVGDVSVEIKRSPLDTREIMALRAVGIRTIDDLADADIDAILPEYLPHVAHRVGAETRLRTAAHRSRLLAQGVDLERLTHGRIALPEADIEIDLDIEASAQNRVYLWGFLIDDRRSDHEPTYHPVARFARLTRVGEADLAEQAASWLRTFLADEQSYIIWHYSPYETSTISHLTHTRSSARPNLAWLSSQMRDHFVDLFPTVRKNFFGVDGLGLKKVAHAGAGFSWRDPDPSGLNSQSWFADSIRAGSEEERDQAKTRILEYNEDDVRATWALRQWLRSLS